MTIEYYPPNHGYFIHREDTLKELLKNYFLCCQQYIRAKTYTPPELWNHPAYRPNTIEDIFLKVWLDSEAVIGKMTLEAFTKAVSNAYQPRRRKRKSYYFCQIFGQGYRKQPHHKPKDKDDSKAIWRQFKGIDKDKAKHGKRYKGDRDWEFVKQTKYIKENRNIKLLLQKGIYDF